MPSTSASTLSTSTRFRSGSTTAASSPMPTSTQAGGGGRRARMRAIRSRSLQPEMVIIYSSQGPHPRSPLARRRGGAAVRSAASLGPQALFCVVNGAGFADDRDFDLSRIFELVLDAAGDVFREPDRLLVGDLLTLDHDPDLAAGLQR